MEVLRLFCLHKPSKLQLLFLFLVSILVLQVSILSVYKDTPALNACVIKTK